VSRKTVISGLARILPLFTTILLGQQTQPNPPAQPTSSIYNRMRRLPQDPATPDQQQTTQTQQFPSPGQQFPPEQQAGPTAVQAPTAVPHAAGPGQQQSSQQRQANPVASPAGVGAAPSAQTAPQSSPPAAQQPQAAYGLALQPPNPPRISYANGELTVVADNASMADVMTGIERATGARLEGTQPESERVFGQFGPGSPRDVLNSLLSGSRYDFILVGAIDDPGAVQTIMLSPHGASPTAGSVAQNQPTPGPNTAADPDEDNDEGVGAQQSMSEAPQSARTPPQPTQYPASEQTAPPQNGQQQQQQQVKTPEQLLQELQRLRQQQQQQQPQQPPQNPR
jgi:hypothetical protein